MSTIPKDNRLHILNEWADAAVNGVQYLRNIRDGIGDPEDAIRAMELNIARIRDLPMEDRITPTATEAQAYLDRKEAEKEAQRQRGLADVARRNREALIAMLSAMSPEDRASLLADAEKKA